MSVLPTEFARTTNVVSFPVPSCSSERHTSPPLRQHCSAHRVLSTFPPPPACRSSTFQQQTSRRLAQRTRDRRRRSAGAAAGTDPAGRADDWDRTPNEKEAALLLRSTQAESQPQVGAEYGEGFVQFRLSGSTHLDVESLNERLKANGANRMRHSMRPDEQYGLVFMFDGVIANTRQLQQRAWKRLAEEEGLNFPAEPRHLFDMRAERVITEVLQWTQDWGRAQALAWRLALLYAEEFQQLSEPCPSVKTWLEALQKANVPCALVSHMPSAQLKAALERMGLDSYFGLRVTAEDDMETLAQRLLSAALKLQRPPDHCVVFVASPSAVTAAHNCTMKAVAIQGAHKGYQLKQADLTLASLDEITVYNIRRLFAQRGAEFMDIKTAVAGKPPRFAQTRSGTM